MQYPLYVIALKSRENRFKLSVSVLIDGTFVSANSEVPDFSVKNRTNVQQKCQKKVFFLLKD